MAWVAWGSDRQDLTRTLWACVSLQISRGQVWLALQFSEVSGKSHWFSVCATLSRGERQQWWLQVLHVPGLSYKKPSWSSCITDGITVFAGCWKHPAPLAQSCPIQLASSAQKTKGSSCLRCRRLLHLPVWSEDPPRAQCNLHKATTGTSLPCSSLQS